MRARRGARSRRWGAAPLLPSAAAARPAWRRRSHRPEGRSRPGRRARSGRPRRKHRLAVLRLQMPAPAAHRLVAHARLRVLESRREHGLAIGVGHRRGASEVTGAPPPPAQASHLVVRIFRRRAARVRRRPRGHCAGPAAPAGGRGRSARAARVRRLDHEIQARPGVGSERATLPLTRSAPRAPERRLRPGRRRCAAPPDARPHHLGSSPRWPARRRGSVPPR